MLDNNTIAANDQISTDWIRLDKAIEAVEQLFLNSDVTLLSVKLALAELSSVSTKPTTTKE